MCSIRAQVSCNHINHRAITGISEFANFALKIKIFIKTLEIAKLNLNT